MLMTREYVLQKLKEEHLWKVGETDTFEVMLSQKWEFTLRKEEEIYTPYKYSLDGKKIGTNYYPTLYNKLFHHISRRLKEVPA